MSLFSHYPSEGARVRFTQTRLLCIQFNYSLRRSWRRYDSWILDIGRVLFLFRIFMDRDELEVYENGKKKNETNTRLTSNHHDWTSLVNNGFITRQRNFALSRIKYNWFISRAGKERNCVCSTANLESPLCFLCLTFFCHYLRPHPWHCPRITNFVSLREIKAGNPDLTRGTDLSRSGNQSEHFA